MRSVRYTGALVVALGMPAAARADDEPPHPVAPVAAHPGPLTATVEERLAFLDARIETQRLHAQLWWESFATFYGVGVIVQTARAIEADERALQADLVVSVVKSAGGLVRYVVDPMKGIEGFPSTLGESKGARLARGERVLRANAKATTPFGPWYAHLINLGINGTGAVIVGAGFDDWTQGLISAGIGFAVGEASLLTQPWEADADLEEYETRLLGRERVTRAPAVRWSLVPAGAGAGVRASF